MKTKTGVQLSENKNPIVTHRLFNTMLIVTFTLGIYNLGFSQNETCNCSTDITFLNEKLRKTPAF